MTRYGYAGFLTCHALQLAGYAVAYGGVLFKLLGAAALLLAEYGVGIGNSALCHCDYGVISAVTAAVFDSLGNLLNVVGYFGDEHYVRPAGKTCV